MRIKNIKHNTSNLRLKAEEMHKSLSINPKDNLTITETKEFIHELEVHQIELEIMNSELVMANEQIWLKEQRIEEANKKFIELYDFAPSGYFSLNKEGDIVELNISGANMLGKPSHRLLRNRFALYISDKTRPIFNAFFEKLIEGKGTKTCQVTLFAHETSPIAVAITGTLSENSATCLINVIDITALNKAEEQLEKSNLLFSSIFYNSPDALIITRLEDELIINCNEKFLKIYGFSSMDEVVGKILTN